MSPSSKPPAPGNDPPAGRHPFLAGGGAMGKLIAAYDWSRTGLGPITDWPQNLRNSVNIMLQSPVAMVILWGSDGIMIYNDAYSVFAGGKHPKLLGAKVLEGWPEAADFNRNVLDKVLKAQTLSYEDQRLTLQRGKRPEPVWMDLHYSPIMDESGQPMAVLAVVTETTERVLIANKQKQTEKALQKEQEHLRILLRQAPAAIAVVTGPDHTYRLANDLYQKVFSRAEDELIGRTIRQVFPEVAGQGIYELFDKVYESGESFVAHEFPALFDRSGDGSEQQGYFNFVAQPVKNAAGKVGSILIHAVDVTGQVKARQRVEEQNRVLEMITSGASLTDTLKFLLTSVEKQSDSGLKASILLVDKSGKHLTRGVAPSLPKAYMEAIDGIRIGPKAGSCGTAAFSEQPVIVADIATDELWKDYRSLAEAHGLRACWSTPIFSSGHKLLGVFAMYYPEPHSPDAEDKQLCDFASHTTALVIEHKRTEEALKESEGRFRTLADSIQNLAWTAEPDGSVTWYNQRWYEYTGSTYQEMRGWGWKKAHHPDHVKQVVDFLKTAWKKGEAWELTFPLRRHDGQYRWFLTRALPVRNQAGEIERWIGTNTDIDDLRRRHEMEQRMEHLTMQRNALMKINKTKDEFIGMASHQLRTPATAVKQYIGLLMNGFAGELTPDQSRFLQVAYDSNERELAIINDLLKTAQIASDKYHLNKKPQDITTMVDECIADVRTALKQRSQTVAFSKPPATIKVPVDKTEMKLAIVNLLENASKYSHPGAEIKVSAGQKGSYAEISVIDEGVGISKDNLQRIFDKFTRVDNELSDTVTGTGLGLYWVKQIVEMHKGRIKLSSVLGKGSTFTIRLPV